VNFAARSKIMGVRFKQPSRRVCGVGRRGSRGGLTRDWAIEAFSPVVALSLPNYNLPKLEPVLSEQRIDWRIKSGRWIKRFEGLSISWDEQEVGYFRE
jgi:hypothetical protein